MNASRIITFEGKSLISQGISVFTGSNQTHVGWQTPDGAFWEAVDAGFVRVEPAPNGDLLAPLYANNRGKTAHIFEYKECVRLSLESERKALEFLEAIHRQPYGFRTLFTFMLNRGVDPEKNRVICSEAVLGASIAAGRPLQERLRPWNCSPADIYHSPLLVWKGSHTL